MMNPTESFMDRSIFMDESGKTMQDEDAEVFINEGMTKSNTKREMNPKFRDVAETGTWGEIGPKEVCRVVTIGFLIAVGIGIALWFGLSPDDDEVPPSIAALKLDIALQAFNSSNFTKADLPRDVDFYKVIATRDFAPAQYRAINWFLFDDDYTTEKEYAIRVALASLYFHLGGDSWKNSTNWLSSKKACDWKGVECDFGTGKFLELNLDGNNLTGTIPNEVALLQDVSTIWLSHNSLKGKIPGGPFAELPKLTVLFLEHNQLTGTVPAELGDSVSLDTLYVQHNDLIGQWPFCQFFDNFGVDCDKVACDPACCDGYSCYESFPAP